MATKSDTRSGMTRPSANPASKIKTPKVAYLNRIVDSALTE